MKTKQAERMTSNIGDIIESLKIMREAISNLRILPKSVEIAALRGATPDELVHLVKTEMATFIQALTPDES